MKCLMIIDDTRYFYLKNYLVGKGIEFVTKEEKVDIIIFPFREDIDKDFFNESYFKSLNNVLIFSGYTNSFIKEMAIKYNLKYYPLMEVNSINILNSIPTSEGVIYFMLDKLEKTIFNSNGLIIGYGKNGKSIADRLWALGSNVSVIVNSEESKSLAISNKLQVVSVNSINKSKYDYIINTVEKRIISQEDAKNINNYTLIIDIAASPFGFDEKNMKDKLYFQISDISGKVCPKTAGEIIGEYIFWVIING